jgi:SAM-dependent methyltransferase
MEPATWVPRTARSILDIGCNVGELLSYLRQLDYRAALAGCDVNAAAVDAARRNVPDADFRVCEAAALPFPDAAFDCVTCIETLEHVPPADWEKSLLAMRRVLRPGGRLILRTPHAGLFGWLDTNNVRFRLPQLYRHLIGRGRRDAGYAAGSEGIVWHYHFTRDELVRLAGAGWTVEATWYGGLLVYPLGSYFLWPFYRLKRGGGWLQRAIESIRAIDYAVNYGSASYGILIALKKAA